MEFLGPAGAELTEVWLRGSAFVAPRWLPSLGILAGSGAAYVLLRAILNRAQHRWVTRTSTRIDDFAVALGRSVILLSMVAWAVTRLFDLWSLPVIADWGRAAWLGLLFFPVSRFASRLLSELERGIVERTGAAIDQTALPMVNRAVRFLIIGLGVFVALSEMGVDIAPLLAGAGVVGLALSLAAKDTLSNLIAGVLIVLDRPFGVGDRIELWSAPNETGTWGDVIEIGLRATKIRNPDNLVVVVPNSEIMQRDIVNYTMSGEHIRLRIPFQISYESDLDAVKHLLPAIAREVRNVKADPAPFVIFRRFGESEVMIQLRVWIDQARERRRVADEIVERAMIAFRRNGIEMPYPKRELYVRSAGVPSLEDRLAGKG